MQLDMATSQPSPSEHPTSATVVVFSSINEDLTLRVPSLPDAGATALSTSCARSLGGKGANTAVAARRAVQAPNNTTVLLAAAVGDDPTGAALVDALHGNYNVNVSQVSRKPNTETGRAVILVDDHTAENCIVVHQGANNNLALDPSLHKAWFSSGDTVVLAMHLEVPISAVADAARFVQQHAVCPIVVLNASPVPSDVSDPVFIALLNNVDVLIVNEGEALALCPQANNEGATFETEDDKKTDHLFGELRNATNERAHLVVTLGARGVLLMQADCTSHDDIIRIPAIHVDEQRVLDTTGAGDCLTGFVCSALAQGKDIKRAISTAVAASALCVQRHGAADAIPTLDQVGEFMKSQALKKDVEITDTEKRGM